MNQGDIVIVPFPYTDLTAVKTRPALVISKNNRSDDLILVAITSQNSINGHMIETKDLEVGELPITSFVKINSVVTLNKSIIRKRVAILRDVITAKIVQNFKAQF